MEATRLVTIPYDDRTKISFWKHNGEIYGLNEYEPVQFDIYGMPLGVRWECSENYWPKLLAVLIPQIADHTIKACMEAQLEKIAEWKQQRLK